MVDYLSVRQVANRLGLTPDGVLAAIYRGALRADKLSDVWLIKPAAVSEYERLHLGRPGQRLKPKQGTRSVAKPVDAASKQLRPDDDYFDEQ